MNLKTALAIAVAAAFAAPLAAQASVDTDKIIVAQSSGSTQEPRDSNPAAPPKAMGPGSGSTNNATGETNRSTDSTHGTGSATAGATAAGGFSALDKNHDGYVSRDEARDATWANRFSELDKDNDGRLSQSEFNAMNAGSGATGKPNTPKQ